MHGMRVLDPSSPAARDLESGRFQIRTATVADLAATSAASGREPSDDETIDARTIPNEAIEVVDRRCFPAPRRAFLDSWIGQDDAHARALPAEDGTLRGYGVIRRCVRGWKVGPLFADGLVAAEVILEALLSRIPVADPWILDIPEPNEAARALVERRGMT